jgi:REP element-mobilizing transposase RayT
MRPRLYGRTAVRPYSDHPVRCHHSLQGSNPLSPSASTSMRGTPGAPVWQRNYYEHIIRNEDDLEAIRHYILTNPSRWHEDRENPYFVIADPSV